MREMWIRYYDTKGKVDESVEITERDGDRDRREREEVRIVGSVTDSVGLLHSLVNYFSTGPLYLSIYRNLFSKTECELNYS